MRKLSEIDKGVFSINSKKHFRVDRKFSEKEIEKCFNFAYAMCFGEGHHRSHRSGGQTSRSNGEKFGHTFQGKLAEVALHKYFSEHRLACAEVDFSIFGKNRWDDTDLTVNDKHINVKSASFFSHFLLLEKEDWNSEGYYIPNLKSEATYAYDFFVLVRIQPDIKNILKTNRMFYASSLKREDAMNLIAEESWGFDIPGYITHEDFKNKVIAHNHYLPKNTLLNGKTKMDAGNYYVQTGNLSDISQLIINLQKLA